MICTGFVFLFFHFFCFSERALLPRSSWVPSSPLIKPILQGDKVQPHLLFVPTAARKRDLLNSVLGTRLRGDVVIPRNRIGLTQKTQTSLQGYFFMIWLYHLFINFATSPNMRHFHIQMQFKAQTRFFQASQVDVDSFS